MIGISNYALYIMTGKSPMSFSLPNFASVSNSVKAPDLKGLIPAGKERAYKWKDADGLVHYSGEPPSEGQAVELLDVDPNTNLVQGLKATPKPSAEPGPGPAQPQIPSGNIYSPETIKELMDNAKGVQDTLNKRYEDLEDM